jgi:hypothetical protein
MLDGTFVDGVEQDIGVNEPQRATCRQRACE